MNSALLNITQIDGETVSEQVMFDPARMLDVEVYVNPRSALNGLAITFKYPTTKGNSMYVTGALTMSELVDIVNGTTSPTNASAATQAQTDAGTATGVYVEPATLQGKIDTDGTLAADSDLKIPSQKAVKAYVGANLGGTTVATQAETNTGSVANKYVSPATLQSKDDDAVALTDAATIDITGPKHTLTTASSRTFTISHVGDDIIIEVTLNATSATFTFPNGTKCWSQGTASGDNTMSLSGTSGDRYIVGIWKIGSNYYAAANNSFR